MELKVKYLPTRLSKEVAGNGNVIVKYLKTELEYSTSVNVLDYIPSTYGETIDWIVLQLIDGTCFPLMAPWSQSVVQINLLPSHLRFLLRTESMKKLLHLKHLFTENNLRLCEQHLFTKNKTSTSLRLQQTALHSELQTKPLWSNSNYGSLSSCLQLDSW